MSAGYSGTPQARKLGIKAGMRVRVLEPDAGWALTDPPEGLSYIGADGQADVVIAFYRTAATIAPSLKALGQQIFPKGSLWIAWPRQAGGHISDITGNLVRDAVLPLGLVDVKIAAIDEDWSGQKVVWRVERRRFPG